MKRILPLFALALIGVGQGHAQSAGSNVFIDVAYQASVSATHICYTTDDGRGELWCNAPGPTILPGGAISASAFIGDGSGLTNLSVSGDRIVSGTHAVTANEGSGYVSLSTGGTDWGYLGSGASYLPKLAATEVSGTLVSASYVQISSATSVLTCATPLAGTLRYTSGTMQVCDGAAWTNVGVGVPSGTISAFATASCPPGWNEYTPARGRFLRGIDTLAAGIDPAGTRAAGSAQEDELKSHSHTLIRGEGSNNDWPSFVGSSGGIAWAGRIGDTGGLETRPKNVAVTFCRYSGYGGGGGGGGGGTPDNLGDHTATQDLNIAGYDILAAGLVSGTSGFFPTATISSLSARAIAATRVSSSNISTSLIQVGTGGGVVCGATTEGAIRYSDISSTMEYCNSSVWTSLGPSDTALPAFSVHKNGANQAISGFTKITWSTERFDTNDDFAASTFTPSVPGTYLLTANATLNSTGDGQRLLVAIYQNGAAYAFGNQIYNGAAAPLGAAVSAVVQANGATDYFDVYAFTDAALTLSGVAVYTHFSGSLITLSGGGGGGGGGMPDNLGDHTATQDLNMAEYNILAAGLVSGSSGFFPTATISSLSAGAVAANSVSSTVVRATNISASYVQIPSASTVLACGASLTGTMRYTSGTMQVCNGTDWTNIGLGVPTGTIAAFAASSCPSGWTEYTPSRGRFLRGIDNGAGNDPGGTRVPGNVQADLLAAHTHGLNTNDVREGSNSFKYFASGSGSNINTSTVGGAETRPKNVAVTFCAYSGYSGGSGSGEHAVFGNVSATTVEAATVSATSYTGLAANFSRITATRSNSVGNSAVTSCPAGQTLINWGITMNHGPGGGSNWDYCACNQSGNGVFASLNFSSSANPNWVCTCSGLCAKS